MKEENKASNKWSRIFRKKWFFPALYLGFAAILLSVVVWYQNVGNQVPEAEDNQGMPGDVASDLYDDEDAESVMDQQEVIKMPVKEEEQAEIVTKFYDYNADEEDQENALILYNNRYHQSTGIDLASEDGESFEVTASLSGTVKEVKEDPLLGNVVVLDHDNDVTTYYASLDDVQVKAGSDLKQGDLLGVAGKNIFGQDNGTHVHFELRKDGKEVNPEDYFNQPVSKLDNVQEDEEADETSTEYSPNDRTNELDGMEEDSLTPEEDEDQDEDELEDDDSDEEDSEEDEEEDEMNPSDDESDGS
ncbi:peptidoglycan DD-metalloendopeptidase family protein [Virgibacillus sp. MSJ-26]|uniref:M23 family metallopeptidase n=1 Tax=Virgibacillus sp. MSJ-26 TaxID=2841522 RepID=UPI001C12778D|nr:M23 family metallopeptidase [Virgibacillus sp. MSJ-26]MBU5465286.1 peptidoglycan DD-metalloendopeptidase family protein [Virgibacillus sp. MSJ-26]